MPFLTEPFFVTMSTSEFFSCDQLMYFQAFKGKSSNCLCLNCDELLDKKLGNF